ncbi:unnamed protein product [Sphagnum jensenii]
MHPAERDSTITRFNSNSESRVLCASVKACGEGISLVGASRVVLLEVSWNPAVARQAISRTFRIGQHRKVVVSILCDVTKGCSDRFLDRGPLRDGVCSIYEREF